MTTVNHGDTEARRTHGVGRGFARMRPAIGVHPRTTQNRSLCVLRVSVSPWLASVIQ